MEKEIWKDVVGYEGLYQVSNLGRVKRMSKLCVRRNNKFMLKEKYMKNHYQKAGYLYTRLTKNEKSRNFFIHRLVATAFIPNPDNKPTVNHINGIHDDNNVNNLEWATYKENNIHAYKNGLKSQKNRRIPILQIKDGVVIKIYSSFTELRKEGKYSSRSVRNVLYGKFKHHHGFEWRYDK